MKFSKYAVAVIFMGLGLTSCNDDDDTTETPIIQNETGDVVIELEHVWGQAEDHFHLGDDFVQPENGDTVNFTKYRYYVSNIMLHGTNGTHYMEEESYHLVDLDHSVMSNEFTITDVPAGSYSGISFMIGVDSTRNVSGSQTGALDPANEMFWSWNTGYIFVKAEGATSGTESGSFAYHLGGFTGPNAALKSLDFSYNGSYLDVSATSLPTTHLVVRVDNLWDATLDSEALGNIHAPGEMAGIVAGNFVSGFRFDHNHN